MKIRKTKFKDLMIVNGIKHQDKRGYLRELILEKLIKRKFKFQIQSVSKKNVLRGLHFQAPPFAQGKLVRVIQGSVLDVVVDIRPQSNTYGKYESVLLSGENKIQFWIPPGFAHGFVTLENNTIFCYKCTGPYSKESEGAILWNDTQLNIDWNIEQPIVSSKDQEAELFKNFMRSRTSGSIDIFLIIIAK